MSARSLFNEELHHLNREMVLMGDLVKEAIAGSFEAVATSNKEKALLVVNNDSVINDKERQIERICLGLLLREQPVARDLRHITAALKIITDLERMGDQAADISEIALRLPDNVSISISSTLIDMARRVSSQVDLAVMTYVKLDIEGAKHCMEQDDAIDVLFEKTKAEIIEEIVEHQGNEGFLLDVFMIAKYLERIGDHAVNVAEWVEYAVDGIHKGNSLYGA